MGSFRDNSGTRPFTSAANVGRKRSPHGAPTFARYASYGGFQSAEAHSAKAEAKCENPAPGTKCPGGPPALAGVHPGYISRFVTGFVGIMSIARSLLNMVSSQSSCASWMRKM